MAVQCREAERKAPKPSAEDYCRAVDDQIEEIARLWCAAYNLDSTQMLNWPSKEHKLSSAFCSDSTCVSSGFCIHDFNCEKPLVLDASSAEQCAEILRTYASRETADKKLLGRLLTVEIWTADEAQSTRG